MRIDNEIKKKVTEDWLKNFTQISAFTQNKLYKVVGPCIIGIELIKSPFSDDYSPYFVIYSLWKDNAKTCLSRPIVMVRLRNNKGLQFDIPYLNHSSYFNEATDCFRKQIPISLSGDVTLKSLFAFLDSLFGEILIKSNSAEQAKLFEFELYAALYVGSQIQIQNVLIKIQQVSKSWNMQMFETWYGSYNLWLQNLQKTTTNREQFLKQIEINKMNKKISKLQSSKLSMTV